jgi:hypothetical protein
MPATPAPPPPTALLTSTTPGYSGTFSGRAEETARVRREITVFLNGHPACDEIILVASELAANAIIHTRSRHATFTISCQLTAGTARIEAHDLGGPWRPRPPDGRPHGLDIIAALTGPAGWGTRPTPAGRLTWARLTW